MPMIHSEHACQRFGLGVVTLVTFDCVAWPVGYIVSLYSFGVEGRKCVEEKLFTPKIETVAIFEYILLKL